MKTKTISKLFFAAAALVILISFAGCNLNGNVLDADGSAVSRGVELPSPANKPKEFTATVELKQDSAITLPVGIGYYWRTIEEVLTGEVTTSDGWPELMNATVTMTNFTNFQLIPLYENGPYSIIGTNHSTVEITMEDEVLTLKANGTLEGVYPVSADVNMNFNSIESGTNTWGKLTGTFEWFLLEAQPIGTFTLTGSYK